MKIKSLSLFMALAILLSACGAAAPTLTPTSEPTAAASATANDSYLVLYKDPSQPVDARVEDLLKHMTLEEKIGQMTQVEKNSIKPGDITKYFIGSILSGGGGSPADNTPQGWYAMVKGFQDEALATPLQIPLVYGVDAVHGHGNLLDATVFPHNIGLGAANDPDLTCRIAQATAEEMLATGIPWNFAPVVAVVQDIRWGRTYEGYSESTDIVKSLGETYVRCLQTPQAGTDAQLGVLATPKHFIGDGATTWGTSKAKGYEIDQGDMQVDEATLRKLFLPPYQAAVNAGAMSIMASFSSWNGTKMHAQKVLLTDLLKGELGFKGFIVSDWKAINQIDRNDNYKSVVTAINAGIDMSMVPEDYVQFIDTMKQAVANGDIPQARVDDAVRRILRAKFELGLFEHPMPDTKYQQTVRSPEHLALAREAVSKSLVLLTNQNNALPLDKDVGTILLTGSGADNIGMQSGGWTLEWQGVDGNKTAGTSIHAALQAAVNANTKVIYDPSGSFKDQTNKADVGIVVVGEKPYAEGVGDSADLLLDYKDVSRVSAMRDHAQKVIVIILSGRPVIISGILPYSDAIVAAWWPGTEGAGITDVLFGDKPFTGKLPYTWPRSAKQLPINVNNSAGKTGCEGPLFPFGYGLTYGEASPVIPECNP